MTITQHPHIYSFHTSNFKFWRNIFSIFFINTAPTLTTTACDALAYSLIQCCLWVGSWVVACHGACRIPSFLVRGSVI